MEQMPEIGGKFRSPIEYSLFVLILSIEQNRNKSSDCRRVNAVE